jgi:hypothetical protein
MLKLVPSTGRLTNLMFHSCLQILKSARQDGYSNFIDSGSFQVVSSASFVFKHQHISTPYRMKSSSVIWRSGQPNSFWNSSVQKETLYSFLRPCWLCETLSKFVANDSQIHVDSGTEYTHPFCRWRSFLST